jgi:hypothetical protein
MSKKLLSKAEQDALLEIFNMPNPQKETGAAPRRVRTAEPAEALQTELEAVASRWTEALKLKCTAEVSVALQQIVRHAEFTLGREECCYKMTVYPKRFLVCSSALINLVNEKALGSRAEIPLVSHALTEIDKGLFESSGAFFAGDSALSYCEKPPQGREWVEARFDVRIAPVLRTTLRLLIDA